MELIDIAHLAAASLGFALLTSLIERLALVIAGDGWSLSGEGDKSRPRSPHPRALTSVGALLYGNVKVLAAVAIGLLFRSPIELVSVGLGTVAANVLCEALLRRERRALDVALAMLSRWLFPLQILFGFFVMRGR